MYITITLLFIIIFGLIGYIVVSKKYQKNKLIERLKEQYKKEIAEDKKRYIDNAKNEYKKEKEKLEQEFQENKLKVQQDYDNYIQETDKRQQQYKEVTEKNIQLLEEKLSQLRDITAKTIKNQNIVIEEVVKNKFYEEVEEYQEALSDAQAEVLAAASKEFNDVINDYQKQIDDIKLILDDYYKKRNAINEEILRQRAINEKQDFYRIALNDGDKRDINYLLGICDNLRNPQILYKLIWTEYIQKPFQMMLKNVLGNTDPRNVIYMITNIKTGEIYVGKTKAEVSKRWTEHIKTSLNIGTSQRSIIHKKMFNHWDEFTFNIVEKVPLTENLGKQEKYYIDFYQSDVYGYNAKSGG